MPRIDRRASLALLVLVLAAACFTGNRPPNVAPRATIALGEGEPAESASKGAFGVVFAGPRGETDEPSEITIVFNRSMRPLDLAGDEAKAPVEIAPSVAGHWNWLGTTGLVFSPDTSLPRATEFKVKVPAGTRALDGSTLAKPFEFSFSTARPAVARTEPYNLFDGMKPSDSMQLRFNQPVDDREVARAVSLTIEEKDKAAFDVKRPDPKNDMLVEIVPKKPLPLNSEIGITIDASLRGKEGPLDAGKQQVFTFRTYGPLVVTSLRCNDDTPHGNCAADSGFYLELSNDVKRSDLKKALHVDPPVKISFSSWGDDDGPTRGISVYGKFKPGASYRVRVAPGIVDEHGQKLENEWAKQVAFDDLWPVAEIGVKGKVFEPSVKRDVPLASINVASYELATAPLDEASVLELESTEAKTDLFSVVAKTRRGSSKTITPQAAKNAVATRTIATSDVLGGKDKRGPMAIAVRYTNRPGTSSARETTEEEIVQVTELAITSKISPYGSLVWVTKLKDGEPVEGADVWIRRPGDPKPAPVKTDRDGIATVPASSFMPVRDATEDAIVFAEKDGDRVYRPVRDQLNGYRFGVSPDFREERPIAMLFTERGIYRPGDTVKVKGIFRREARVGTTTPKGETVDVSVAGPDGEAFFKASPVLSPFGTFALDVKVPDTSRLGTFEISATLAGGSPREGADTTESFEVAEYRAAEFKASVESDKPSYVRGDKASFVARGDYLFGAPMANADARLSVTRAPTSFTVPNTDDFVTDDYVYSADEIDRAPQAGEIQSATTKLDAKGAAAITAQLTMPSQRGPELVTCEATIDDVSRQEVSASSSRIVHPAEFYVAMKPPPDLFVSPNKEIKPELLAVTPKGERVPGQSVRVELVQRTWTMARQTVGGGVRTTVTPVDKVLDTCDAKTAAQPVACAITPKTAGYFVLRASAKDKRGNPVSASVPLYVLGDGEVGWGDSDDFNVKLVADKKQYEVGQTAHVLVKSPWKSADALVTVERAGVMTRKRMSLAGGMPTIDVPITDDLRPNTFVSVVLLKPRTKAPPQRIGAADVGAPAFRMGYAELSINPDARRLKVSVKSDKSDYRPGDTIAVDVDVKDRKGAPARGEVTLYAVDEGVLSLVGYKTPDPIAVFGAPRNLKVATLETRDSLASVKNPFANLGLDKGMDGGGGGGDVRVRKDFRASAYYNPSLFTDDSGHVHASFKLPDSLTTYRVMAVVAGAEDAFGYGEASVTTSKSLMARPAFPRFLRAGDAFEAGVVLNMKGMTKQKIEVDVSAEGLTIKDATKKTVEVDPTGTEVRFAMEAPKPGKATVRFKARSINNAFDDAVEITRTIETPGVMEAVALYGDTTDASADKLGDLSAMRDDVGGLEVAMSSTALVGLDSGVEQLVEYPYGCTEQLTSKLVPMLPLKDLAKDYGFALPKDVDKIAAKTVAEILKHQKGDGGFGMWEESDQSNPWASIYAVWGLTQAKKYGALVPASAYKSGLGYAHSIASHMDQNPWFRATAPFAADVLAEAGDPDVAMTNRLFESRDDLPLFSRAFLLHAMALEKSDPASVNQLAQEIQNHLRLDGNKAIVAENLGDKYAVLMDSDARTTALVLRALLTMAPDHPLGSKLAMGLLSERTKGAWRSTQEAAWALLALDEYRKAQEKLAPDFTARVFLGDTELTEAAFKTRDLSQAKTDIPAAKLVSSGGSALSFAVDGSGKLFYEARLRYARKVMPRTPLERGFFVKKTLRRVSMDHLDEALRKTASEGSSSAFDGGDLVLGEIDVVTPTPREYVVVEDPLPAGFEAIDARLATTGKGVDIDAAEEKAEAEDQVDDNDQEDEQADTIAKGQFVRSSSFVREVRDDRVLFFVDHLGAGLYRYRYLARATSIGSFVVPPAKAEEMYQPEVFGRTGSDVIVVRAK